MQKYSSYEQFLIVRGNGERALQPITIFGYVGSVRRATQVIGNRPSQEKLLQYMQVMYSSKFSYSYKTNTALALELWSQYLGVPTKFGRQKKPRAIIKDTLTEAEVTRLIFNCKNIREKAIIAILAYSGLRNSELCKLKVKDVLVTQNAIRVIQGKGLKDGMSEISPECTGIVLKYLKEYSRPDDGFLFTTLRHGHQYNPRDTRKLVHVVARRAKFEKRVYPHILRHSMASNMLLRGANIMTLKEQLRHSWLDSTFHYVNSIVFVEKNQYQKHAPSYL